MYNQQPNEFNNYFNDLTAADQSYQANQNSNNSFIRINGSSVSVSLNNFLNSNRICICPTHKNILWSVWTQSASASTSRVHFLIPLKSSRRRWGDIQRSRRITERLLCLIKSRRCFDLISLLSHANFQWRQCLALVRTFQEPTISTLLSRYPPKQTRADLDGLTLCLCLQSVSQQFH